MEGPIILEATAEEHFPGSGASRGPFTANPIETVFLDAGGVLCHPSWTRVADALVRHGAHVTSAALAAAEQKATRDIDDAHTIGSTDDRARGWLYFNLVLHHAGVTQDAGTDAALSSCASTPSRQPWEPSSRRRAALAALTDRAEMYGVERQLLLNHLFDSRRSHEWFESLLDSNDWASKPQSASLPLALDRRARATRRCTSRTDHVDVVSRQAACAKHPVR